MSAREKKSSFLDELYSDDDINHSSFWKDFSDESEDSGDEVELDSTSTYSTNTSLLEDYRQTLVIEGNRDRSRSPIIKEELAYNIKPSSSSGIVIHASKTRRVRQDPSLIPDAHIFVKSEEDGDIGHKNDLNEGDSSQLHSRHSCDQPGSQCDVGYRNECGRNIRASGRSERARRSRGAGRRRLVGNRQSPLVGHPLEEIWINDNDVPEELWDIARDVVKKRERAQEIRDRAARSARDRNRKFEWEASEDEDEFQDEVTDGWGHPQPENNSPFQWFPIDTFHPKEELFTPKQTGALYFYPSAYAAFRSIWDDSIIEHIAEEMNRYARGITSSTFQKEWQPTNAHEVICLFAFWMMLGIVRLPTIRSCFSTDPLLRTEIFRKIFTIRRYILLTKALDSIEADPSDDAKNASYRSRTSNLDKLQRLRPIITHLNARFQENYVPSQDISIDESLTLWKGKSHNTQSIRTKATKIELKTYELCESSTGYMCSFVVFTDKQCSLDLQDGPLTLNNTAIVKKLIDPLLNKGYRLFMNDTFSSPRLARFLKRNGTDCVGTLRPSRADVPVLIDLAPLKERQLIARHSGDICVLTWQDLKRTTMISTCHGSAAGLARVPSKPTARPVRFKPQVVLDYKKSMGGVDLKDQMLEPYLIERQKRTKWYMKLFKRLLNVSIVNARILMESSVKSREDQLNFRLALVDSILNNHLSLCPQLRRHVRANSLIPDPLRMTPYNHWPIRIEEKMSFKIKNRKTRVRCFVCTREGRSTIKTAYRCEACNVPLCIENCFKKYHTT